MLDHIAMGLLDLAEVYSDGGKGLRSIGEVKWLGWSFAVVLQGVLWKDFIKGAKVLNLVDVLVVAVVAIVWRTQSTY